jgi:ferrochelatase
VAAAEVPRDPVPALSPRSSPVGVLLSNVGSPQGPDTASVRAFLREFLSDPGVVDLPRALWLPILHGLVLPLRSRSSARLYARIWTEEGSPLVVISRRQRIGIEQRLGPRFRVALGMRYGKPSLAAAVAELAEAGCRSVLIAPLFPQESFSTTGSTRIAAEGLARERGLEVRTMPSFCEDEGYVRAVAGRVRAASARLQVDHHVFSFHGLPERSIAHGDPYRDECQRTARALARELRLADDRWTLAFQSRFGRRWLKPFTDEVVADLAGRGKRVLVATPGFAADCLETLEEIGIRLRESVRAAGGLEIAIVPALNDDPTWLDALAARIRASAMEKPELVAVEGFEPPTCGL